MWTERKVRELKWSDEEKGTEIVGRLVRIETVTYADGAGLRYLLRTNKGEVLTFAGTSALNRRIYPDDVGKTMLIKYLGQEASSSVTPGLSPQKLFQVSFDESSSPNGITNADVPF